MKKLKPYPLDSFNFHKIVISSKNSTKSDKDFRVRVSKLNDQIEKLFTNYKEKFDANKLEELTSFGYANQDKEDLERLYSYPSRIIQDLKHQLTTTPENRKNSICSNCTIGEVNSFDHALPQSEFPEFIVNPFNLFPSCSKCNTHKSTIWRQGNKRLFLNLYTDEIPEEQFLFVKINVGGNVIETIFHLVKPKGVSDELFEILETHYKRLHLFERFSENSDSIITGLINTVQPHIKRGMSLQLIKDVIIETNNRNKKAFGYNYWKSILESALIHHDQFIQTFIV